MKNIEKIIIKWLVLAIASVYYYLISKENNIGLIELTTTLVGTLIGILLWELIAGRLKKIQLPPIVSRKIPK